MDVTFFGIDVKHAVEAQIKSLSKECTTRQRGRQHLELSDPSIFSAVWGRTDLERSGEWYETPVDSEIRRHRAEELKLLAELEQAHDHRVFFYRVLRMRPMISALRGVLQRRGKSALSNLTAENIRDIGQCLDLNTRISMCRFIFGTCMVWYHFA